MLRFRVNLGVHDGVVWVGVGNGVGILLPRVAKVIRVQDTSAGGITIVVIETLVSNSAQSGVVIQN